MLQLATLFNNKRYNPQNIISQWVHFNMSENGYSIGWASMPPLCCLLLFHLPLLLLWYYFIPEFTLTTTGNILLLVLLFIFPSYLEVFVFSANLKNAPHLFPKSIQSVLFSKVTFIWYSNKLFHRWAILVLPVPENNYYSNQTKRSSSISHEIPCILDRSSKTHCVVSMVYFFYNYIFTHLWNFCPNGFIV